MIMTFYNYRSSKNMVTKKIVFNLVALCLIISGFVLESSICMILGVAFSNWLISQIAHVYWSTAQLLIALQLSACCWIAWLTLPCALCYSSHNENSAQACGKNHHTITPKPVQKKRDVLKNLEFILRNLRNFFLKMILVNPTPVQQYAIPNTAL